LGDGKPWNHCVLVPRIDREYSGMADAQVDSPFRPAAWFDTSEQLDASHNRILSDGQSESQGVISGQGTSRGRDWAAMCGQESGHAATACILLEAVRLEGPLVSGGRSNRGRCRRWRCRRARWLRTTR
jgi:hypothetical protein